MKASGGQYGMADPRDRDHLDGGSANTARSADGLGQGGRSRRFIRFTASSRLSPAQPLTALLTDDSSVVVTPELLMRLKVQPGDTIRLGGKEFRITGTLLTEPDRLASGFGPGMRVLMTRAGLERTGLIQFGSRAAQRFLFKLKPDVNLDAMKAQMKSAFPRRFHQRLP